MDLIFKDLKLQCKFFKIQVFSNDRSQSKNDPRYLGNISWSRKKQTMVNEETDHGQFNDDPRYLGNISRSLKLYIHMRNGTYFLMNLLTETPFSV